MSDRRYPRTARVNELLREVVAETLERIGDDDERVELVTVTGVEADPDLRHARVFYSSLRDDTSAALDEHRVQLQSAIGKQVRMKRTPQLEFVVDPAVATGARVEEIIRGIHRDA